MMKPNKAQKGNIRPVFDDVVVRLWRETHFEDGDVFHAQVRQAPRGVQGGPFRIKSQEQLDTFHQLFTQRVDLSRVFYNYTTPLEESSPLIEQAVNDLAELGHQLYDLLPVSLRDELPRLIQEQFERERGIRLIIEASAGSQADRLLSLPWELLFFKETRVYPARSRRLLIVRRLLDAGRHSPIELEAPFDLVHLIADDPQQRIEDILQEMERETIPAAIAPGAYTLIAEPGSVQKLLTVMKSTRSQILHFVGHGEAPKLSEEKKTFTARGYLCFVNENGTRQWLTGERLQHLLSGTPGLQLIVLNACHGASVVTSHLALDLVYNGFPYVVAMQAKIHQEAARHFIRAFYSQLQEGQSLEYAVAAARFEIAAQLPGAIDWCLPVLYTNVGLENKHPLVPEIENLGQWVKEVKNVLPIILGFGSLHLVVGILLWLSDVSHPLPDPDFMRWTTGWLVAVPPLLTAWIFRSGQLPIPTHWPRLKRLILVSRLLGIAALTVGGLMLCLVWFSVVLLVGLGFWGPLSPIAHLLLLLPLQIGNILLSYTLTHRSGLKWLSAAELEEPIPLSESIGPPIAGYTILLIALYLSVDSDDFYTPPNGNLFIGLVLLAISYTLHRTRPYWENEPEAPFSG